MSFPNDLYAAILTAVHWVPRWVWVTVLVLWLVGIVIITTPETLRWMYSAYRYIRKGGKKDADASSEKRAQEGNEEQ